MLLTIEAFLNKTQSTNCNEELFPYLFVFLEVLSYDLLFNILQVSFDWLNCWKGILCLLKQNPGCTLQNLGWECAAVCSTLQETLTLLQTKICDFSPISDQTLHCRNYFGLPKILTRASNSKHL